MNKIMKKALVLVLALASVLVLCAFTYDENKQRVFDYADVLTDSEETYLEDKCKEYSLKDELDYVIVTTDNSEGKSAMEYADDFFANNGFGYNKEMGDGTLFLVTFDTRKYWFSTSGNAINNIDDNEISCMNEEIEKDLRNADYFEAFEKYITLTSKAYNGKLSNNILTKWYFNLLIAVVVGAIVTVILGLQQKSKMTVSSNDYSTNMHANPSGNWDRYIRTTTTRTRKSSDSKGGGGSSHIGSSGNSHGGGGGSF